LFHLKSAMNPGVKRRFYFALPLLVSFAVACGGHKTQVNPPVAKPVTSSRAGVKVTPAKQKPADQTPISTPSGAGPEIRIGLETSATELRISSSETFYVTEKNSKASRKQIRGEVRIEIEQKNEAPPPEYQIQAAAYKGRENAEALRESLDGVWDAPVTVYENRLTGMWQVRVGAFAKREDAQKYLPLVRADYPDAFIVLHEKVPASEIGKPRLMLRGSDGLLMTGSTGFLVTPASGKAFLKVNGKPYRGSFDIFLNKTARISLVNQLAMEDYLPGVVPAEMSPSHYPEFAALAAQSIAARTYALKNIGRYRSEDFDLTNDTRTQVYGGVSAEKAETTEIVRRTAGIAIYYDGKPIDAMFMSTCGGRTEDYENVYGTNPVPYLKGVICAVESGYAAEGIVLSGAHEITEPFHAADGSLANRNIELAGILGLIPSGAKITPEFLIEPLRKDDALKLVQTAGTIAGKTIPASSASKITTMGGFIRYAAEAFFGGAEIRRRISLSDADYYMTNLVDGALIPEDTRLTLSYLMQRKLWRPNAKNAAAVESPVRRGDAVALLLAWIETEKPEILRKGTLAEVSRKGASKPESIKIKGGGKTLDFALSPKLRLFRIDPGQVTPARNLKLIGAEKCVFHLDSEGKIDFLETELSQNGAASDRFSPSATWKTTLTLSSVAEKLRALISDVGDLKDLQPYRIGSSGRVVQVQAVGSRKSTVILGYKVRTSLGLQDTLYTLTREFNADGGVHSFTFHGRGYGHGVGLCQTGASGMAKAGKSYEEILKTYYTGVVIKKAY